MMNLTDVEQENISKVRADLFSAMVEGEVSNAPGHAMQLAINLLTMALPDHEPPEFIEPFSFTVGAVLGAAAQKYDDLEGVDRG